MEIIIEGSVYAVVFIIVAFVTAVYAFGRAVSWSDYEEEVVTAIRDMHCVVDLVIQCDVPDAAPALQQATKTARAVKHKYQHYSDLEPA